MKKIVAILLMLAMLLSVCGCTEESVVKPPSEGGRESGAKETQTQGDESSSAPSETEEGEVVDTLARTDVDTDTEWAIYWYLCGSDLETDHGAATLDLIEMMEVQLPEHVQVIIQTGGSLQWQNDQVNADKMQRYLYDSDGLQLIEEGDAVNMGDADTLEDFLTFAYENYPAKRSMISFWNHGGGSLSGVAFDERYYMDGLELSELRQAFVGAFGEDPEHPAVDIVGFDACLMASIDTANIFTDMANYMVASEEVEPGNGWQYSGILGAIADDPQIAPVDLAKAICDTYQEGCEEVGTEDEITLSVINLTKVGALVKAYEAFGQEALSLAAEDPASFTRFAGIAESVENYGGNTRETGYTDMMDLGHFAEKAAQEMPQTSGALLSALNACVVYKVNGRYHPDSYGISCYYAYSSDERGLDIYDEVGAGEAFLHYYRYGLTGEMDEAGLAYLEEMDCEEMPELQTLESVQWDNMPLSVDENGCATLTLGPQANEILTSISFALLYASVEDDVLILLGWDNDIVADWENGVFKDNFRGVWGCLDGHLCYMELIYEGEDINRYVVPILLNGEEYNLLVTYDFTTEEFIIDGARKPMETNGAADKNLYLLQEGDEIQTIHYAMTLSGDETEFESLAIDTITYSSETTFEEQEMGDGEFYMAFTMEDAQGNLAYSEYARFNIEGGQITTTVNW